MTDDSLCSDIFRLLAQCAQDHRSFTYSKLGRFARIHDRDLILHSALGTIWHRCFTAHDWTATAAIQVA